MWTSKIFTNIYSRLKANGKIRIQKKYPKLTPNFVDSTPSAETLKYPCIVVKELQPTETGRDIEARFINGVIYTLQIEVITNTNQSECNGIADIVLDMMKEMSFEVVGIPFSDDSQLNDYRNISRYRREIDSQDVI